MSIKFQKFLSFRDDHEFTTFYPKLREVINRYSFHELSEKADSEQKLLIISQNLKESKVIVIGHYEENYHQNFVVSFKQTILIINELRMKKLQNLLSEKENLEICFFEDTKKFFDALNTEHESKIEYKELKNNEYYSEEITEFNCSFLRINTKEFQYNDILYVIKSCISGYLITKCYNTFHNIDNFDDKIIEPKEINEDDIIQLRPIGTGSKFQTFLYYHIEYDKFVVVKKLFSQYDDEIKKLVNREIKNYNEINYPFIPKFYGTYKIDNVSYPVIEFINGKTLLKTDFSKFSEIEIYDIIFQILLVFNYLHANHFIYRDIKQNNIMIDHNTIVLIDFDRMIKDDYIYNVDYNTKDLSSPYEVPEINLDVITNKYDVYSIGSMIMSILKEAKSVMTNYDTLFKLFNQCINKSEELRPSSFDLINDFIFFIKENCIRIKKAVYYFTLAADQNNPFAQNNLGLIYEEGKFTETDINKAIYYFSLAANQNNSRALYNLGRIYYENKYIERDIKKAIYYFTLAANQNHSGAQNNLGYIYSEGKYIIKNMDKAIYYYTLAANQNHSRAQYNLGIIYLDGIYTSRDINKSIYYFTLAANQNDSDAQYNLGIIYLDGIFISRDINKSIYYFTLAANQNHSKAQYILGMIYSECKYVPKDINKAIHYYKHAADQNDLYAQNNLGSIYYTALDIPRDINQSIKYYTLAAKQNDSYAQYNLGIIYEEGKYITKEINKAIYYYTLSANQNNPGAQYMLGIIYLEGKYIAQDNEKAISYFIQSANQNFPQAQYILGDIYKKGKGVTKDMKKALYYYSLAANNNHSLAQYYLGLYYIFGFYVEQNARRGFNLLSLSSNNNCIQAHFSLGFLYQEGDYKNIQKSLEHYYEASSLNYNYAKNNLGILFKYLNDLERAKIYLNEAIEKEDHLAMYNLAHIYIYNEGSKESIDKSIILLAKSSRKGFSYSNNLLYIALELKYGKNNKEIQKEFVKLINENDFAICYSFKNNYLKLKDIDFVYDIELHEVEYKKLITEKNNQVSQKKLTKEFYEGFKINSFY